jgi:hypothetical protein
MRLAVPIAIAILAAAALAACGGGSEDGTGGGETAPRVGGSKAPPGASARDCAPRRAGVDGLRATALSCDRARRLISAWLGASACELPAGASRAACGVAAYRCLSVRAARGIGVSCARSGHSVSFTVRP